MATPLGPDAIIQMSFVGSLYDQQTINTWYYHWAAAAPDPDYTSVMNLFATQIISAGSMFDAYKATLSASWSIEKMAFQPVYPTRLRAYLVPGIAGTPGGNIGTDMQTNCAATITKTTDEATRWGTGSIHLPGMIVENLDADTNEWNTTYRGLLNSLGLYFQHVFIPAAGTAMNPIVWAPTQPGRQTPITGFITQATPRVSRRRTLRIGR